MVFQTLEEVSFSANGITAAGVKAFDGVLQSNIMLKVLNLSGNSIGDEGVKVSVNTSIKLQKSHRSLVSRFYISFCDMVSLLSCNDRLYVLH